MSLVQDPDLSVGKGLGLEVSRKSPSPEDFFRPFGHSMGLVTIIHVEEYPRLKMTEVENERMKAMGRAEQT